MSGILNNKNRIIDYILTDNGRQQLSTNDFKIKYATFIDNIHYDIDHEKDTYFKVSRSENAYLPLEPHSNCDLIINNEYNVYSKFELNNNIFKNNSNYTTSEKLLNINTINSKKFINYNDNVSKIIYKENYDFNSSYFIKKYLTIKSTTTQGFKPVIGDPRFLHKTNFKKLIPINISGMPVVKDNEVINPINFIFRTIKSNHSIQENDSRESAISKCIDELNKNECFNIEISIDNMNINSYHFFELNEIKSDNTYEKLHFINLGEVYDRKTRKYKKIYLIGKFKQITKTEMYLNEYNENNNMFYSAVSLKSIKNSIYLNSKETGISYNKQKRLFEATFINMFTMVLE